jgi:hypothetical protein
MRHGIKRWIVLYRFHRYKCRDCGATFLPEKRGWSQSKFGSSILLCATIVKLALRVTETVATSKQAIRRTWHLERHIHSRRGQLVFTKEPTMRC